ncbi:MAG: hypothetical protein IH619_00420, partial [Ignavibacterium sp.]|nr:hypothetical protein [Ignavibacterium sp.]
MYKNWLKIKKQEEKERLELKRDIDERLSKFTAKDWKEFRETEFDVKVIPDKEAELRMIEEERKVDSIIDGSFWKIDNPDFNELSDEEIGMRGKELLQQLKPFYRNDLIRPFSVQSIHINITKEIKENCTYNGELYEIKPESWSSKDKTGYVIDCDRNNIYYKPKANRYYAKIEEARKKGLLKNWIPSIATYENDTHISLRELYEERVDEGLNSKKLKNYARSNDMLDQIFFLYVIKRAQKQDEIAAGLIAEMYENAALRKVEYWLKRIEEKRHVKFKKDSELGKENVQLVAKIFLRMLITGDDPEAIFDQIKKLSDPRNIEIYFTRKLGSKIKILVEIFSKRLKDKAQEYQEFKKNEGFIERLLNAELSSYEKNEITELKKKIVAAGEIAKNTKRKRRTTYRDFIKTDKLSQRIKLLYDIYCESEDFLITHKVKGFPSLEDEKFNDFADEEKMEFEKVRKEADSKASTNEYNDWYTYREFLDETEFTDNEKKMFEIYKKWEDLLNTQFYPMLGAIRLDMQTFSNPYSWFSAVNWFNDKIFKAAKNKNFTNWLLGGMGINEKKPTRGALIDLMNNWLRSSNFMKDTRRGIFKDELLEVPYVKKSAKIKKLKTEDSEDENYEEQVSVISFDENFEKREGLIEKKLMEYKKETN